MVDLCVSVITDEFSLEFDEVCEYLQSRDVTHVELRNVWLGNVVEVDDRTIHDAKDVLDACGLGVSCIAGPLLKCLPPSVNPTPTNPTSYSSNWQYNYSLIDRAMEVAELFDAPYIRCFGYNGKWPVPDLEEWDAWPIYAEWQEIVAQFKARASAGGRCFVCENEGGLNRSLPQMERIGKDNAGPGFGLLYDTANVANKFGAMGVLTDDWLPRLAPYIQYVHAKGCKFTNSGTATWYVNGEGDICRWPALVEYFASMAPGDFVAPPPDPLFLSIETHMGKEDRWENSARSLTNLLELVAST